MPQSSHTSKNNGTSTVFAWIAAILVNAAFSVLLAWSLLNSWITGFAASVLYTVSIFWGAFRLKRSQRNESSNGNTVLTSVLFLLAVLSIGITTFIPVVNLIGGCSFSSIVGGADTSYLPPSINTTGLSDKVAAWVVNGTANPTTTFAYFPQSQSTIFLGDGGGSASSLSFYSLWKVDSGGAAPEVMLNTTLSNPSSLILVSNGTLACFVSSLVYDYSWAVIACTDGINISTTEPLQGIQWDLLADDDLIWFKVNASDVYSARPKEGLSTLELHDGIYTSESTAVINNREQCNTRSLSLGVLFFSAIPVFVAAVMLQIRHEVPSMTPAAYLALTTMLVALAFVIKPSFTEVDSLLSWWLPLSSLILLICNIFGFLTNRIHSSMLSWSTNFSGIVFMLGMSRLIQVPFGYNNDALWSWIVATIVVYFPLIALSIILEKILLMVLGAIGILFDVWRLVTFLTESLPDSIKTPVTFVVLALAGIAVAAFGLFLNKHQDQFSNIVKNWSSRNLSRWILNEPDHNFPRTYPSVNGEEIEIGRAIAAVEKAVAVS